MTVAPDQTAAHDEPQAGALQVLWTDDHVCAINKPAGWVVHRGWAQDAEVLTERLAAQLERPVYPCHRLDRQTSGVLLVAVSRAAARALSDAFASQQVQKSYLALVRGHVRHAGRIEHPLPADGDGPRVWALSEYAPLSTQRTQPRETSWVRVQPKSGRTHQVRRHLKHISHPIIGDANYGKGALNRAFRECYALERLALHAESLCFRHPGKDRLLEIRAPLPMDLEAPLRRMGYPDELLRIEAGGQMR